jgi:tetratricopeptide (TPR) repeat protein
MDGRQSNIPLEELTTTHKNQGDMYAEQNDYIGAAGQYSYALNYFLFNNNPEIAIAQLYFNRGHAYLETQRYAHARCDLYTAISNQPTAAVLQNCYITLRKLYFLENNASQIAEEKTARDLKALQPELYQSLVKSGAVQVVVAPQLPGFFTRLFRSAPSQKAPNTFSVQAGTELVEPASLTKNSPGNNASSS